VFLQQSRGPGVELDHIAVVGIVLRAVEALDIGMGYLDYRHAAFIPQGIEAIEILTPEAQGSDVAFAIAGILD